MPHKPFAQICVPLSTSIFILAIQSTNLPNHRWLYFGNMVVMWLSRVYLIAEAAKTWPFEPTLSTTTEAVTTIRSEMSWQHRLQKHTIENTNGCTTPQKPFRLIKTNVSQFQKAVLPCKKDPRTYWDLKSGPDVSHIIGMGSFNIVPS